MDDGFRNLQFIMGPQEPSPSRASLMQYEYLMEGLEFKDPTPYWKLKFLEFIPASLRLRLTLSQ